MKKIFSVVVTVITFLSCASPYPGQSSGKRKEVPGETAIFKTVPKPIAIGKYYYLHDFDGKKFILLKEDTSILQAVREHINAPYVLEIGDRRLVILKGTTIDPLTLYTQKELAALAPEEQGKLREMTKFEVISLTQEPEFTTLNELKPKPIRKGFDGL